MEEKTCWYQETEQAGIGKAGRECTLLFVYCDGDVSEYQLKGCQRVGRAGGTGPDIVIANKYVSRSHGSFDTTDTGVRYTTEQTTNGIYLRGRKLSEGESVELCDGDELRIPAGEKDTGIDVLLVCAFTRKRANIWQSLKQISKDALTGIPLRNGFAMWYYRNRRREGMCGSLFILDIDYFKQINDTYGHNAGDIALKTLADNLSEIVGESGYVCRWGGDEFVGVIKSDAKDAMMKLSNLNVKLAASKINDQFSMTISAGLVYLGPQYAQLDHEEAIKLADTALYNVKKNGRNGVHIYE